MTKEEKELIFNRLFELEGQHLAFSESIKDNAYCEAIADVKHIIDGIKETPLPSNLDEAANNYGIDIRLGYPRVMDETDKYIYNAFKAGAEWMAEQGCTVEIDEGYFINNPQHDRREGKFHKYYSSVFGHSKKITVTRGDDLVVQIRKK